MTQSSSLYDSPHTVPVCKGGREISGGKLLRGIGAAFACGSCDSSGCLFHNMEVHTGHRICWSERPFGGIVMGCACKFGTMHIVFHGLVRDAQ